MAENKSSFHCKQFSITQHHNVLKVNTESLLFGGFCAQFAAENCNESHQILDIGSGTGLLSLMVAQQCPASITAVEIDSLAHELAIFNASSANFSHKINFVHQNILTFTPTHFFDFIISNPPFFQNQLKSPQQVRNGFLHDDLLKLTDLGHKIAQLLNSTGSLAIILPIEGIVQITEILEKYNIYPSKIINIHSKPNSPVLRQICFFQRVKTSINREIIVIKEDNDQYTNAFKSLLGAYYQIFD